MKMPEQKPGRSRQDYATPPEFLDAVEREFGEIVIDLAASDDNRVCPIYYNPIANSLGATWVHVMHSQEWKRVDRPLMWLNPPYANIALWARKCAAESQDGARIAFLVPASVGANWFWDHVAPHARVFALSPRLSFDGKNPFPKDLILAVYDRALAPAFERWQWRAPKPKARAA